MLLATFLKQKRTEIPQANNAPPPKKQKTSEIGSNTIHTDSNTNTISAVADDSNNEVSNDSNNNNIIKKSNSISEIETTDQEDTITSTITYTSARVADIFSKYKELLL